MIKKRLLTLAARLDRIAKRPPKKRSFDLSMWFDNDDPCNTACCAVGEATLIPEFRKLGFGRTKGAQEPSYKGFISWAAVRFFFDISEDQSHRLFMSTQYQRDATPDLVAARIREFVTQASDAGEQ